MKRIYYLYLCNLFLGFHYYLIIYVNSSFLGKFVDNKVVDLLYIGGALLNILFFILSPRLLGRFELKTMTLGIIVLEFLTLFILSRAESALSVVIFFIIQQGIGSLIVYCLDIYLEAEMPNEKNTGSKRAVYLTAMNISLIASFFLVSLLASDNSFSIIYLISAMMLLPIIFIVGVRLTRRIPRSPYVSVRSALAFISKDFDILRILFGNFILQIFYSVMVIYLPILLHKVIGFAWSQVGLILIIMILPFIIFEIPVGRMIDRKTGEKEFLFLGFIIMAAACFTIPFLHEQIFWLWAMLLFISRIGASLVEIASESYFFKKVTERHESVVSLFRMTQSLAYVVSPLIAIPALLYFPPSSLFDLLGGICLLGLLVLPKRDTR